jgi:thioredoxin 1
MSDSPSDELERIREQKRKELLDAEEHSGEDGNEASVGDEEPPGTPIEIESRGEFEHVVDTYEVVLVDCYADWCGPCQQMEPAVEAVAAETDAAVAKVDIDVNQALAGELGVRGVPTIVLFVGGEPTERLVGAQDRATLEGLVGSA